MVREDRSTSTKRTSGDAPSANRTRRSSAPQSMPGMENVVLVTGMPVINPLFWVKKTKPG